MKKIGITGGIGSGKSTVARVFQALGYAVYFSDERAKWLMVNEPSVISALTTTFGAATFFPDGQLNRQHLAGIAFSDANKLQALNQIVHPAVARDFDQWVSKLAPTYDKPFILKEAAILYESGAAAQTDGVITVYAPKSLRLQRVISRDGTSPEAVLARMDKQWPDTLKVRRASFTLYNDGKHSVLLQVAEAIKQLKGPLR